MTYALIGDLHSQLAPLVESLLYCEDNGLTPIFLGDIFDSRCEQSHTVLVYELLRESQKNFPGMQILRSNHQDKLERWLKGNEVKITPELQRTIDELTFDVEGTELLEWLESMPYGFCFRNTQGLEYRCAHAYFPRWVEVPEYEESVAIYEVARKARQLMMYGPSAKEGKGRLFWWRGESDRNWCRVAGHYHAVHESDRNLVLDGGCGGIKRSWFCNEEPVLCLYDVDKGHLVEFDV
jgi:hypothetical protein